MDYQDELFNKMPFYMTYPLQNLYLTEMEYERDMERMKELYPKEVRILQQLVEEYCDEMEYEGSRMYDENPDRKMLEEAAKRLLERFLRENPQYGNFMPPPPPPPMPRPEDVRPGMPMPPGRPMPPQMRMQEYERENLSASNRREYDNTWLPSLIEILFHDEIYRRRCRNRRCRRWW